MAVLALDRAFVPGCSMAMDRHFARRSSAAMAPGSKYNRSLLDPSRMRPRRWRAPQRARVDGYHLLPPWAVGTASSLRVRAMVDQPLPARCAFRMRASTFAGSTTGRPSRAPFKRLTAKASFVRWPMIGVPTGLRWAITFAMNPGLAAKVDTEVNRHEVPFAGLGSGHQVGEVLPGSARGGRVFARTMPAASPESTTARAAASPGRSRLLPLNVSS